MITTSQTDKLAKEFHIDGFTITREYIQLVFLSYLYQNTESSKIFFKGGTAIRLLLGSPRFSEDLDFSSPFDKKFISGLIQRVEKQIGRELPGLRILPLYSGKTGIRFRIRYQPVDFKYPMNVRLDFTIVPKIKIKKPVTTALITKFPIVIFPLVLHLSDEEILKEKLEALANRSKGRDLFDIWYLLEKGISPGKINSKKSLERKISAFPQKQLDLDLAQFLPSTHRSVTKMLKDKLITVLHRN